MVFLIRFFVFFCLNTRGTRPCARSNHVATLFDDKILFVFGGSGKNKTLNDLYSLDFETVMLFFLSLFVLELNSFIYFYFFLDTEHFFSFGVIKMVWSRIKIRGFHPSPRAGSCGVLCGTKWYISGGGSRKKSNFFYLETALNLLR